MDRLLFVLIALIVLVIGLVAYLEHSRRAEEESKYENCYQKGGSLIREYKSELYICAKVERIKS